jgi:hypothetical protein
MVFACKAEDPSGGLSQIVMMMMMMVVGVPSNHPLPTAPRPPGSLSHAPTSSPNPHTAASSATARVVQLRMACGSPLCACRSHSAFTAPINKKAARSATCWLALCRRQSSISGRTYMW